MYSYTTGTTELWFELTIRKGLKILVPLSKVVEFEECYDEEAQTSYTKVHFDRHEVQVTQTYDAIVKMIKQALKNHNPEG